MRRLQERWSGPPLKRLRPWAAVAVIAVLIITIDQLVKSWALDALADENIDLPGPVTLRLVFNPGIAFGLGKGFASVVVPIALLGFVAVLLKMQPKLDRVSVTGVSLVLGGAIGNLVDRWFRDTGGAVVDYVDLPAWPVFNLADACIVLGAVILVLHASRKNAPEQ